jgi:hypothetical protein
VLLSGVSKNAWTLNLALKANPQSDLPGSYWWQSTMTEKEVLNLVVTLLNLRTVAFFVNEK